MIPLQRVRTEPAIHENFRGAKRIQNEKELMQDRRRFKKGEIEKQEFNSDRWKKAKDQLKSETHDKCAYCEAPTLMVAYGDVEHYRPKSEYWWLAYCYENYLVSCQICNQKFKKAKFPTASNAINGPRITNNTIDDYIDQQAGKWTPDPLHDNEGMSGAQFRQQHKNERPYLINPYFEDPSIYFAWKADDILGEVELIATDSAYNEYIEAATEDYGLNRQELKNLRYFIYYLYSTIKVTLQDPGISPATRARNQEAIKRMKADNAPFAAMIRYFESLGN